MARSTSTSLPSGPASRALELFNPPADALYDIDMAARLSDLSRRTILVCCKYRLVGPTADSSASGYQFSGDTIHALRRVAALREVCGNDFLGIKVILELMDRLEQMHSELQMFRAQQSAKSQPKSQRKIKSNRRFHYGNI
jgi:DNA-binding transcriptional MerR regulator